MKFDLKHTFFLFLISILICDVQGQTDPIKYSQYLQNSYLVNPAFAGHEYAGIQLSSRQVLGDASSPSTAILSGHGNLRRHSKTALGSILFYDSNGPFRQYGVKLSYAYTTAINSADDLYLALGLSGGLSIYTLSMSSINIKGDKLINSINNEIAPSVDFGGLLFKTNFFIGLSFSNIFVKRPQSGSNHLSENEGNRNYMVYGGYLFELYKWGLEPSVLANIGGNLTSSANYFDFNLKFYIASLTAAISYRHQRNSTLMIKYQFNKLGLGLAYEYPLELSGLSGYTELVLSYQLN